MNRAVASLVIFGLWAGVPAMARDISFLVADCARSAGAKTISYVARVGSDRPVSEQVKGIRFNPKMKLSADQDAKIRACVLARAKQ